MFITGLLIPIKISIIIKPILQIIMLCYYGVDDVRFIIVKLRCGFAANPYRCGMISCNYVDIGLKVFLVWKLTTFFYMCLFVCLIPHTLVC